MKQLFTAIAIIVAVSVQAQKLNSYKEVAFDTMTASFIGWGIGYSDNGASITKWDDGRFEIRGDTLKAIQLLWNRLDEANKSDADLWKFIGASVDFTNHVPDYWKDKKNNPAWSKYAALLRKNGYIITTKKKK